MSLTVTSAGFWKPQRSKEPAFVLTVEVAKSGRARCRRCSEFIQKNDVRVGVPIRDPRGEYGYISAWQHLKCSRLETGAEFSTVVHGFSSLSVDVQRMVQDELSKAAPPDLETLNPDDLVRREKLPQHEPPPTLLQHLLPYQKEGLWWLIGQEQSETRSGILADEMGMGKTIQMISLILARPGRGPTLVVCPVSSMLQWEEEVRSHVVAGTLRVRTVAKVNQLRREELEESDMVLIPYPILELSWRCLVNEHKVACAHCGALFLPRKLRVHNKYYCGPNAKRTAKQLKRDITRGRQSQKVINKGLRTLHVDVDLDENEGVETVGKPKASISGPMSMYEELMMDAGRTVRSRWDAKRPRSSSSSSNDSDSGNEESDRTESTSSSSETDEDVPTSDFTCASCKFPIMRFAYCPKTGQHHVLNDVQKARIESDTGGDKVNIENSVLHSVRWFRVVLDEAHRIKSRTTSTTKAACALNAEHKWLLTGTPLQNRVGDLYTLLRFMKFAPFSRYFCGVDGCSCSSLSHPFSGSNLSSCIYCGHGPIQHYSHFNKFVMNPITRYGYVGDGRRAMMLLSRDILSKVMLRRTKQERADELSIPPCVVEVRKIQLTLEERDFYESLYKKSTAQFDTFVSKGTILHNYAHIFQLLSRLRQALDHPFLAMHGLEMTAASTTDRGTKALVSPSSGLCGLCQEIARLDAIQLHPCKHTFHNMCLRQLLESTAATSYTCPTCFVKVNIDLRSLQDAEREELIDPAVPPEFLDDNESGKDDDERDDAERGRQALDDAAKAASTPTAGTSGILSRIDASKPLHGTKLNAITRYAAEEVPEGEKCIIFSQFGAMLDMLSYWLKRSNVRCVKLVGSMTLSQRQAALQVFRDDASMKVILISLKAGGEGLNLQHANHVILVDPWWNPAVEMQAVQRAHRIGQTRPVHAVRFATEGTVEERMLSLQEKKLLVFEGTIDGKLDSLQRLSEEDLQFLFTRS